MNEFRVLKREIQTGKITYIVQEMKTIYWDNIGEYETLDEAVSVANKLKEQKIIKQTVVYET